LTLSDAVLPEAYMFSPFYSLVLAADM